MKPIKPLYYHILMKNIRFSACLWAFLLPCIPPVPAAESGGPGIDDPLAVAKRIGGKLVRDTPFEYRLCLPSRGPFFDGMRLVDFGRTFGTGKPGVAYAYTHLVADADREFTLQTAHNDACRIWLNGEVVYEKKGRRPLELRFEERSLEMPGQFTVHLRKGANRLLIKSETYGGEWLVCLQPPSVKGAVVAGPATFPAIGLEAGFYEPRILRDLHRPHVGICQEGTGPTPRVQHFYPPHPGEIHHLGG